MEQIGWQRTWSRSERKVGGEKRNSLSATTNVFLQNSRAFSWDIATRPVYITKLYIPAAPLQ